jgi:ATP-binding cassette, subfamily C, bacterial CydC
VSGGRTAIRELLGDQATGKRLVRPAVMTVLAFWCGAGLLGLAGWFLAASAVAGMTIATTFSFLYPSAGVQALAWSRTLGRYGERISTHKATLDLVASLRTSLFARALRLPRDRVAELRSSELLGRITVDSDAVEHLLLRTTFPILAAVAALIGTAALFSWLSVPLAVAAVTGLVVTGAILVGLVHHQAGRPARASVSARSDARRTLIEILDGLPELRSLGAEQQAATEVAGHLSRFTETRRQLTRLTAGGRNLGTLLGDLTLLAVVAIAAGSIGARGLAAPAFVAVCLVTIAVFEPVAALPAAITALARARAAASRLDEVFPGSDAPAAATHTAPARLWPIHVGLGDRDTGHALRAGDIVLLTGVSGSGKSTILRAISGQPKRGIEVSLAGVDAASVDPDALAERITLVAQDAHVFDGTIRDNLQLADPAAGDPEFWRALAAAALDDTFAAFPAGLDTPVGPGGQALSGGQRRRLSVAQGLLRRADVLLLDEPTESLDAATAARLLAGVRAFDPNAALVIALHDRQSRVLPWTPTARVELRPAVWAPVQSGASPQG